LAGVFVSCRTVVSNGNGGGSLMSVGVHDADRKHEEVWLYTDGASRDNPGPAAIGILVTNSEDGPLTEHAECIGLATNNEAEYRALIKGLAECARFTTARVRCVSDSELMVRQLTGEYRTKEARLRELQDEVRRAEAPFGKVTYSHRPRSDARIRRVDRLVNAALDAAGNRRAFRGR
jgi:ribonuclease HI